MERAECSWDRLLTSVKNGSDLKVHHAKTAMYNALSALNHIHSANLSLRNISGSSIMIDEDCQVKLGDLNQVRAIPPDFTEKSVVHGLRKQVHEEVDKLNKEATEDDEILTVAPSLLREKYAAALYNDYSTDNLKSMSLSPPNQDKSYQAPEVIMNESDIDPQAADIWSMACVFAEMIYCVKERLQQYESISSRKDKRKAINNHIKNRRLF